MADKKLTAAEVTYLLVEAGAAGRLTVAEYGDCVRITGPKEDRTRAFHVLMDHGLTIAPYPDHDDWIRR